MITLESVLQYDSSASVPNCSSHCRRTVATHGNECYLFETPWPEWNTSLLEDEIVTVAIQVNGKLRAKIEIPRDSDKELTKAHALTNKNVQRAIEGKKLIKVVIVPNKVVNVVV